MKNDEPHDCKLKEKGFCECTEDINLGLNAEENAQALDAIEHGSEATLSDEKPH